MDGYAGYALIQIAGGLVGIWRYLFVALICSVWAWEYNYLDR